jgi:hypothetical protein
MVERQCAGALPIAEPVRQCLQKVEVNPDKPSGVAHSDDNLDPPSARQFRITARVTGPKGTRVWVQALVTKGNNAAAAPDPEPNPAPSPT